MRSLLLLLIVAVLGGLAWVRFAPADPVAVNILPDVTGVTDRLDAGGYLAARALTTRPEGALRALDVVARATARTTVMAGSVDSGTITYQTRSLVFGFPDYTTVSTRQTDQGALLVIYARLRFGKSDLGVNKARVDGWLAALGPLVATP